MEESNQPSFESDPDKEDRYAIFVELYTQHSMQLYYFLMALLSNQSDASDVLQETSLVLWKKFDEFEVGTNFYAWACKIARIQTLKFREKKSRNQMMVGENAFEIIAKQAAGEDRSYELPIDALEECLEKLNETDRKLVRNRYEPNATVTQIANELGTTANKVSKSLYRIRRALLICIERKLSIENH